MMLLCNFVLFNDIAKADSVYSLDYGWESELIGSKNGESGLIEYDNGSVVFPTSFEISDVESRDTRSFLINPTGSSGFMGYWNLTTSFNYISTFSFWVNAVDEGNGQFSMNFTKDGVDVLKIMFDATNDRFEYEDTDSENIIFDDISPGAITEWVRITVTHIDTNLMNYSLYNESGGLKGSSIGSTMIAENWDTFDSINFWDAGSFTLYFDDFDITTSAGASGWETCQGGTFLVTKLFYDSIGYYNDTLSFTIQKNLLATGYYGIYNSTNSLVQSSSFNSQTFPTWYFVDPQYGTGTYYMKVGYEFGNWLVSCPFTIITSTAEVSDWSIRFEKASYTEGDEVDIFYKIPLGEYGNISITLVDDEDTYSYKTYNDLYGTGTEVKMNNIFTISIFIFKPIISCIKHYF